MNKSPTLTFLMGHHLSTNMTISKMVITYTLMCTFGHMGPTTKNLWPNFDGPYMFLASGEIGQPGEQLHNAKKLLKKPRCWCEQLGIRMWWHPQLFHIRKLTESWCDRGRSLILNEQSRVLFVQTCTLPPTHPPKTS